MGVKCYLIIILTCSFWIPNMILSFFFHVIDPLVLESRFVQVKAGRVVPGYIVIWSPLLLQFYPSTSVLILRCDKT